jgi:hypothetical protein
MACNLYYHRAPKGTTKNILQKKSGEKIVSPGNWTQASWVTRQAANHYTIMSKIVQRLPFYDYQEGLSWIWWELEDLILFALPNQHFIVTG